MRDIGGVEQGNSPSGFQGKPPWLGTAAGRYSSQVTIAYVEEFLRLSYAWEEKMIRLIAVAGFALAVTTSAQAMTPAPIPQPDGMITQVRLGCGPGRTRVNGVCVARTTIRQTRRAVRRDYRRGN